MSLDLEEEPLPSAAEPECKVWTEGGFNPGHLCTVTDDVVAVHDGTNVTFVFLKTGKSRVLTPKDGRGVSCLAGRDDLSLLAWSDLGPEPAVHVYQYAAPAKIKNMEGDCDLEYISLAFNQKGLLLGLSGVPDYRLTLWSWETEERICTVDTGLTTVDASVSFSPDAAPNPPSKVLMLSSPSEGLTLWKVKRCGQQRRLMQDPVANVAAQGRMARRYQAATWHGAAAVFVLDAQRELFKYDLSKDVMTNISVEGDLLSGGKNLQMRCHFDGLIVFSEDFVLTLDIRNGTAQRMQYVPLEQKLIAKSVSEFSNTFSYISWTSTGNLFLVQTTETAVAKKWAWENEDFPRYLDVALVRPDEIVVAAITDARRMKVFDVVGKDLVLSLSLDLPLSFLVALPNSPVLVVGTRCGRLLSVALRLSQVQIEEVYEDLELEGSEVEERRAETMVSAECKVSELLEVHNRPLLTCTAEESHGRTLLVAGGDGHLFLLDISEDGGRFLAVLSNIKVEGEVADSTFRDGTVLCLLAGGDKKQSGAMVGKQIIHIRVAGGSKLEMVGVIELKDPCSGISLDRTGCYFFSFLTRKKAIAKYILQEHENRQRLTPVSRVKTTHQLGICSLTLLEHEDALLTRGLDGRINLCPASFGGGAPGGGAHLRQKQLFHYQRGGVARAVLMRDGGGFCAVDGMGALAVFEVKTKEELRREAEMGEQQNRPVVRSRRSPTTEKSFVAGLMAVGLTEEQSGVIADIVGAADEGEKERGREEEQTRGREKASKSSWSERKEATDLMQDRMAYDGEILDIEQSLASIKEQVGKLLELNEELPEVERLERSEFELNTEEKQRRIAAGQEKEANLHLELRAWQTARRKTGLNIRKEVWDDLEVRGMAVRGLSRDIVVRNYPLLPASAEEVEELALAQKERKTAMDFRHLSEHMQQDPLVLQQDLSAVTTPRAGRGSDSLRAYSRQQAAHPSRDPTPSPRALSRRAGGGGAAGGDPSEASSASKKDGRFMGSLSHEFIGFDGAQQLEQLGITTRMQIVQQIRLLKNVVRRLKLHFNEEFDKVYSAKDEVLRQIQGWLASYSSDGGEGEGEGEGEDNKDSAEETKHRLPDFQWTALENPLLDLPAKSSKKQGKAQVAEDADPAEKSEHPGEARQVPSRDREAETLAPDFMQGKRAVDFSPAEVSAADDYLARSERRARDCHLSRRGVRNSRVELERRVDEAVEQFDRRLAELYAKRLRVEKCVLTEELKMRLLDRKISDMEDLEVDEKRLKQELLLSQRSLCLAEVELQEGKEALAAMRENLVALHDSDKAMEKNFKKAFPSLNYNQLEVLMKSFKRRPNVGEAVDKTVDVFAKRDFKRKNLAATLGTKRSTKDLRAKSIASTLERMSNMFLGTALTKPLSSQASKEASDSGEAGRAAFTLDDLDLPSNCPTDVVDLDSWNLMCKLRREKIRSEERIAQLVTELAETEESVQDRQEMATKTAQGLSDAQEQLVRWKKERNRLVNNVELVLTVSRGQLEIPINQTEPEVPGAVLLTESVVTKLNQEIGRLGESKLTAMTEGKDFRAGTRMLQWEKDKLSMELGDLQAKWTDIQQTKLSKESRQALQSTSSSSAAPPSSSRRAITDDYAQLDRSSRSSDAYLGRRSEELDATLEELRAAINEKEAESDALEEEVSAAEAAAARERDEVDRLEGRLAALQGGGDGPQQQGAARAMQRNLLQQKIQEQHELILSLQEQLDTYIYRSFPSLG